MNISRPFFQSYSLNLVLYICEQTAYFYAVIPKGEMVVIGELLGITHIDTRSVHPVLCVSSGVLQTAIFRLHLVHFVMLIYVTT